MPSGSASCSNTGWCGPSFVPPRPISELRDLTRYRKAQIDDRVREVQRLDTVLRDAGIKLSSVASRVLGASSRRMLEALVAGTHDPDVLAELAKGRLRQKLPALREALAGRFRSEHHGLLVSQILAQIDYLDESIATLSARIEQVISPFADQVELLRTIPGVDRRSAEMLIAEIGTDMRQFPSAHHLASWAGLCPGNHESGGKRRNGRTRKGSKWLRAGLTESAKAAARSKGTYLAARHARLKSRSGASTATGATRHAILLAAHTILDATSPTQTSAPTTSTVATTPSNRRTGSSANSNASDTPSAFNQRRPPNSRFSPQIQPGVQHRNGPPLRSLPVTNRSVSPGRPFFMALLTIDSTLRSFDERVRRYGPRRTERTRDLPHGPVTSHRSAELLELFAPAHTDLFCPPDGEDVAQLTRSRVG